MCVYAKSGKYLEIFQRLLHSNYSMTICVMKVPALIDLKSRREFYILKKQCERGKIIILQY